jgi:hypothetical protein
MISEFSSNFFKLPAGRQDLIDLLLLPALDSHWLEYLKGRGTLLHGGYLYLFFSSKMEQTLHSPSYGSQKPPHKEKN